MKSANAALAGSMSTEKAKELGATVHMPPTDIPEVGRFSVLQDPSGAAFALFKGIPQS